MTAPVLKFLKWLSLVGFAASFIIHALALRGHEFPSAIFILHVVALFCALSAIWPHTAHMKLISIRKQFPLLFGNAEPWMKKGVIIVGIYAVTNFIFFLGKHFRDPKPGPNEIPPAYLAAFAGHWMAFFFFAYAIHYSTIKTRETTPPPAG